MVITCYDETQVDARAVNLTNNVGTITIVPVNFSYPSGSFRVESDKVFTHFTASVTAASGNHVFKITGFTAINAAVVEYYYELDYLKDYWFRYNVNGSLIIPHTLLISEFSLTRPEEYNYPIDTHVTNMIQTTQEVRGNAYSYSTPFVITKACVGVMAQSHQDYKYSVAENNTAINTCGIYCFETANYLPYFWSKLLAGIGSGQTRTTYEDLYGNIENCFYVPFPLTTLVTNITGLTGSVEYASNMYYINEAGGHEAMPMSGELEERVYKVFLPEDNGIIDVNVNTGCTVVIEDANDLPPYKSYKLYIPYIGWYEVPFTEILRQNYHAVLTIWVKYRIDLINGQMSAKIMVTDSEEVPYVFYDSNYETPFVKLPTFTNPSSTYATTMASIENSKNSQILQNTISSLGALVPAVMTGNPLMAIPGAAINTFNKAVNTQATINQAQANAQLGAFTSGVDSTIGQTDRVFKMRINEYYCSLTRNEAAVLTGYPVNQYVGGITPVANEKYWLDMSSTQITGPEWYVNGVKSEYSKEYITLAS